MNIEDFTNKSPRFLPELEGWAVLESVLGELQKRCTITADGHFDAATSTVHFTEHWTFDDGHSDTLAWQIQKIGEGQYKGKEARLTADAEGQQAGFAFHWVYSRNTPQSDGSSTTLNFDDWFYLIDERVCIVRGSAGRFGLPFASVFVTYRKLLADPSIEEPHG
jgi:Protein of unknown function (DUF3833)